MADSSLWLLAPSRTALVAAWDSFRADLQAVYAGKVPLSSAGLCGAERAHLGFPLL